MEKANREEETDVRSELKELRQVVTEFKTALMIQQETFKKRMDEFIQRMENTVEDRSRFSDPTAEFATLKETDGIIDYHHRFELIKANFDLSEEYLIGAYLAGLKEDMKYHVEIFHPKSVSQCFLLGKMYERMVKYRDKKIEEDRVKEGSLQVVEQVSQEELIRDNQVIEETESIQEKELNEVKPIEIQEDDLKFHKDDVLEEHVLGQGSVDKSQESGASDTIQVKEQVSTGESIQREGFSSEAEFDGDTIGTEMFSQVLISDSEPYLLAYEESVVLNDNCWEDLSRFQYGLSVKLISAHQMFDVLLLKSEKYKKEKLMFIKNWKFKFKKGESKEMELCVANMKTLSSHLHPFIRDLNVGNIMLARSYAYQAFEPGDTWMNNEWLSVLVVKHHTSKVEDVTNLRLTTHGFSGEVLSSLCALGNLMVEKFSLQQLLVIDIHEDNYFLEESDLIGLQRLKPRKLLKTWWFKYKNRTRCGVSSWSKFYKNLEGKVLSWREIWYRNRDQRRIETIKTRGRLRLDLNIVLIIRFRIDTFLIPLLCVYKLYSSL